MDGNISRGEYKEDLNRIHTRMDGMDKACNDRYVELNTRVGMSEKDLVGLRESYKHFFELPKTVGELSKTLAVVSKDLELVGKDIGTISDKVDQAIPRKDEIVELKAQVTEALKYSEDNKEKIRKQSDRGKIDLIDVATNGFVKMLPWLITCGVTAWSIMQQ